MTVFAFHKDSSDQQSKDEFESSRTVVEERNNMCSSCSASISSGTCLERLSPNEWHSEPETTASTDNNICGERRSYKLNGVEHPRTPSPPNGSRLCPAANPISSSIPTDSASQYNHKSPPESSLSLDGGLLAAQTRAWAAEQRALAAENALDFSWAQTAEAEATTIIAQRNADALTSRVNELEAQLAMNRAAYGSNGANTHPTGIFSESDALPHLSSSGSVSEHLDGAGSTNAGVASTELWPPAGLTGAGINWAYEVEAADALPHREEALLERLEQLEAESEISSVRLAAAFERMTAMTDMLRGSATIAFGSSDLSARRIRHHMFQALDADADGFLGEADLEHWYRVNEVLLETHGYEVASLEQIRQQLTDALHNPQIPAAFASHGKVSMLQLSRSKMGAGVVSILLNLNNMMQDRSSAEWGASTVVSI